MSLAKLRRLQAAWEKAHPKHAQGGEVAVAGFSFQFLEVLLASVRAWLAADPTDRRDPRVFAELLSDIADVRSDGVIVVTQVKYTQSSGMVISALEDLFRVYCTAARSTPDLLGTLDLRILSARPSLKEVGNTIARWQPENVASSDPLLAEFRALVRADIHADPEDELLALLANEFRAEHPLTTVRGWMGRMTVAAGSVQGYAGAARDIWNDLISLEGARARQKASAIYVWTAIDRPPEEVAQGRVLTGQQPQVHHLREGYFAPRDKLTLSIVNRLAHWAGTSRGGSDETLRLPLYWICGRSGAGKSVMLLYVLALLHERGAAIILFPPSVAHLPATIRWSREIHRPGRQVVIALDDPYAPAAVGDASTLWRDSLDELHAIRQTGDSSSMPLLVCCGPTEQAERLRDEMPDDVSVMLDRLPDEIPSDIATLRDWYRNRTGHEPPEVGDQNVLLVQLFFEWRVGTSMPEFATRFRKRINAVDRTGAVEGALAQMLAVNRLYVGAIRSAIESGLSASLLDALDRLRQDNHLTDDPSPARPGLWLAHPHLAEAIYTSWFPAPSVNARREHLKGAILGSLRHGVTPAEQTAPIWAISRVLGARNAGTDISERIDEQAASAVLRDIYEVCVRGDQRMTLAHLPVWIQVRCLSQTISLKPDPVAEAIARLGTAWIEETGLRLTCHKLLENLRSLSDSEREAAFLAILHLLNVHPEWRGWVAVMEDAIARTSDSRLWPIVAGWVKPRIRRHAAQRLLLLALSRAGDDPRLTHIALEELAQAEASEEWSRIAAQFVGTPKPTHANVLRWIEAHLMQPGMAYLLGIVLRLEVAESERWALAWTRKFYLEAGASHVLEALCSRTPSREVFGYASAWLRRRDAHSGFLMEQLVVNYTDDDVRDLAMEWLAWTSCADGTWAYVWTALWKQRPSDALEAVARDWLARAPTEHGSWGFVWIELWKQNPNDAALAAISRDWLAKTAAEHGSWSFVWLDLWKHQPDDAALAALARDWLGRVPAEHGSWSFVWEALWKQASNDEALTAFAYDWLAKSPVEHRSWQYVWQALWKQHPGDKALAESARAWLGNATAEHASWKFVWQALWHEDQGDEALATLGRNWLSRTSIDSGSWGFVWRDLWNENPNDATLATLANHWLEKVVPVHGSWGFIWLELWKQHPGDGALTELARHWLANAPVEHGSWQFVWKPLWKLLPGDDSLAAIACSWLAKASTDHRSWNYVWQPLWKHLPGDSTLAALAREWLAQTSVEHMSWRPMWEALCKQLPGDASLAALACKWLAETPAEHTGWKSMWEAQWIGHPGDDTLKALAQSWLRRVPAEHGSWGFVWLELWKRQCGDDTLAALARDWLARTPATHGSWSFVWQPLWLQHLGDKAISALAHDWLAKAPAEHGSWSYVWRPLWAQHPGDKALAALARDWLAKAPAGHGSWQYVWQPLWKHLPGNPALVALARNWLRKVSADRGRTVRYALNSYRRR